MDVQVGAWVIAAGGAGAPAGLAGLVGQVRGVALEPSHRGPGSLGPAPAEAGPVFVVVFPSLPYPQQALGRWLRPAGSQAPSEPLATLCARADWLELTRTGEREWASRRAGAA